MDWHPRYHRDALDGMRCLSLEERGAYQTILDLLYDYGRPISDDARWLAGWMGVSVRRWQVIREGLITKGKIQVSDGVISNSRAVFEIEKAVKQLRNSRESGARGGRKTAELKANANKINGHEGREPTSDPASESAGCLKLKTRQDIDKGGGGEARGRAIPSDVIIEAVKSPFLDPHRAQRLITTASLVPRWLEAGADLEIDVIPAIRAVLAKRAVSEGPVQTWSYFDAPVRRAVADRLASERKIETIKPAEKVNDRAKPHANARGDAWDIVLAEVEGDAAGRPKTSVLLAAQR